MENKILIDSVNNLKVALNEISVYDFDVYTSMELYYKIAENFNKVIRELSRFEGVISEEIVKQNEKLIYLLDEGLNQEVVNKIDNMVETGVFDNIINLNIFNNLKEDIKNVSSQLEQNMKKINEKFNTIQSENNVKTTQIIDLQNNKLDKNSKLTRHNLDTSTDDNKIALDNLSEEVKSAMTGETPVSATIGDGDVTTEKLADGIINSLKLKEDYNYVKKLTTEDLNTLTKSGLYLTESQLPNKPSECGNNAIIKVEKVDEYIIQTYVDTTSQIKTFRRIIRTGWFIGSWYEMYLGNLINKIGVAEIKDKSVTNIKLSDNFLIKGEIPSGTDLDTLVKEGRYLGIANTSLLSIPVGFESKSFYLDVFVYGTGMDFKVQQITELDNPKNSYRRTIRNGSELKSDWELIGNRITGFENKIIVNFGDSIFGNTQDYTSVSSNIANKTNAVVVNAGFGGCRMSEHDVENWNMFSMNRLVDSIVAKDFTNQYNAIINQSNLPFYFKNTVDILNSLDFTKVDIITISYGTNDFSSGIPLLDNNDNKKDVNTFGGSFRYSVEKLLSKYPNLKIVILTPTVRFELDSSNNVIQDSNTILNEKGNTLLDYIEKQKEICSEYQLVLVDNYNIGMNKFNHKQYFGESDGVHHNTNGRKVLGEHIGSKLMSIY